MKKCLIMFVFLLALLILAALGDNEKGDLPSSKNLANVVSLQK